MLSSHRRITEKFRDFPVKQTAKKLVIDTAINTLIGCLASSLGSKTLGLDQGEGAAIGAAGNAVFGACRSLISSIVEHCKSPEPEEKALDSNTTLTSEHTNYYRNVANLFKNQLRKQGMLDSHELTPADHAAIARGTVLRMVKYDSFGIIGNILGYALLNLPPEFTLEQAALTGATGAAELLGACLFVASVAYCAPYLSNKFVDAFDAITAAICCDGPDSPTPRRSP